MAPTIINRCWSILAVCGGSTLIPHRMGSTGVRLALLLCFVGHLEAQSSCGSPELKNGYFVPEDESYDREDQIFYTCEKGHKPAAEGWWARSLCRNGTWFPKPQCINESACLPPEIPNAVFSPSASGWYQHEHKIRITCNEGFEHQGFDATTVCENGSWSTKLVCTKSAGACGAPPQVLHAVVVNRAPLEVFPQDSRVQYQCKDGYVMEGRTDDQKFVHCIGGKWSEAPTCERSGACGAPPQVPHAVVVNRGHREVFPEFSQVQYQCTDGYAMEGGTARRKVVNCIGGKWSEAPTCTAFCRLDPDKHRVYGFRPSKVEYLKEGEEKSFSCEWDQDPHTVIARCKTGEITLSSCCRQTVHDRGACA